MRTFVDTITGKKRTQPDSPEKEENEAKKHRSS